MQPVVWAQNTKAGLCTRGHSRPRLDQLLWFPPSPSQYNYREIQPALQAPPQENQAMGFLPTGCPLSRASNSSLPAPLAPGESRISIACLSLTSLAVPSRLPFLLSSQARVRGRSRVIWTLLTTGSQAWKLSPYLLGGGQLWCRVTQVLGNSSCSGLPPSS